MCLIGGIVKHHEDALACQVRPVHASALVNPLGDVGSVNPELTEETCRWPIGDPGGPDFFFCGGQTVTGLPYCGYHSRVAYQPAADRRRDRRQVRG